MSFERRLKTALVGDATARFVYIGNFEVERAWARGEPKLPGAGISFANATVNRMEEMGVLLAGPDDVVLLKEDVDAEFAAYLDRVGAAGGVTLPVGEHDPELSVTDDALASPDALDRLRALADGRTYLMPMGVSEAEERLAKATGLPLAGVPSAVCKAVNGKAYGRRLVESLGLTSIPGAVCETAGELADAVRAHLVDGGKVVVKESLGVSGRGMVVLDTPEKAERLARMVARRGADAPVDLVVERWIDKAADLNYQFIVSRTGEVAFETVKAAVVAVGVHKGHEFPPELPVHVVPALTAAADLIGRELYAAGYFGVVGVDALLAGDGTLYPCLEINARFNMATYQSRIAERFIGPGKHAVAATFGLRLAKKHSFAEVAEALGDLVFEAEHGVLVNAFATLNARAEPGGGFPGRIYALCIADSADAARALRADAEERLKTMAGDR
ncbi:ATP-grasp domain-containing protein [Actinosynnema sp. CS-041913]|uniref:preATP grasp domain-containing protein n=1 Tax=Actinosynnema sp. CS-041913 TaxID=3239917 RepID=UPI003D935021